MIIAIDGPAGAGKSTIAKEVARKLAFLYIDTGAMYRALTLKALKSNLDLNNFEALVEMAKNTQLYLDNDQNGNMRVIMDNRDVSKEIRQPRITQFVSDVSKIKGIRQEMLKIQRQIGKEKKDVVLDGRDIGTVVFPDADKKFYLDADFKERIKRRYKEMKEAGQTVTLEEIEQDLKNRDLIDSTREVAPLKKAEDAVYIDSTNLNIGQVIDKVLNYIPTTES